MVNEDFSDIHIWSNVNPKWEVKACYKCGTGEIWISKYIFKDFGDGVTNGLTLVAAINHETMHKILHRLINDSGSFWHRVCFEPYNIDRDYQNGTESVEELI